MFAEGVMTEEQAGESTRLMYILCDVERIGNLCSDIAKSIIVPDSDAVKYPTRTTITEM